MPRAHILGGQRPPVQPINNGTQQPVPLISATMRPETLQVALAEHMPKIDAAQQTMSDALAGLALVLTRAFNMPCQLIDYAVDPQTDQVCAMTFRRMDGQSGIITIDRALLEMERTAKHALAPTGVSGGLDSSDSPRT